VARKALAKNVNSVNTLSEKCVMEDCVVSADARLGVFVRSNWENLSQDMAQGQGEYLASLATLLKIPSDRRPIFFSVAQQQYHNQVGRGASSPEVLVRDLRQAVESRIVATQVGIMEVDQ